jgi:transposase-like protein
MADTADRILDDLRRRRDELKPLVGELERIEAAIDALERAGGAPSPSGSGNGTGTTTGRRRGRPRKGEPNRSDQFLALVREGGTSIPAAAERLGMGPNYLYRLANTLESEGTIRKQGREYVMNVESEPSENAEVLPEPEEAGAEGRDGGDGDDLVADEGVNEGTQEIAEE